MSDEKFKTATNDKPKQTMDESASANELPSIAYPGSWIDITHGALFVLDFEAAQIAHYFDSEMNRKQLNFMEDELDETEHGHGNPAQVPVLDQNNGCKSAEADTHTLEQRQTSTRAVTIPPRKRTICVRF